MALYKQILISSIFMLKIKISDYKYTLLENIGVIKQEEIKNRLTESLSSEHCPESPHNIESTKTGKGRVSPDLGEHKKKLATTMKWKARRDPSRFHHRHSDG
jgi:hypothetical protein